MGPDDRAVPEAAGRSTTDAAPEGAAPTGDVPSPTAHAVFDPIAVAARNWRRVGWGDAATGMAAVTSVMRAHQLLLARVEELLRPDGLTFARYEVLMILAFSRAGELPMAVVGRLLQVHPASVTGLVNRLEEDGLVVRRTSDDDGRVRLVRVTPRGRALSETTTARLNAEVFEDDWLSGPGGDAMVGLLTELRLRHGDLTAGRDPRAGDGAAGGPPRAR